jgi:hypothetical protein
MDQERDSRRITSENIHDIILLILKFLSGGVIYGCVAYLTYIGKVDEQTFLVISSSMLSAIGVHSLVKKN